MGTVVKRAARNGLDQRGDGSTGRTRSRLQPLKDARIVGPKGVFCARVIINDDSARHGAKGSDGHGAKLDRGAWDC